jgi:hypothetical protein
LATLLATVSAACVVSTSANAPCTAGESRHCACPGGAAGAQFCHSDGVGFGACQCGPSAASVTPACQAYAAAFCAQAATCNPVDFARTYTGMPDCQSVQQGACVATLVLPTVTLTASQRMACATARSAQSCDDYQRGASLPACASPAGLLATGAGCSFSAECQSAFCQVPGGAACGACAQASTNGSACPCSGGYSCVNNACAATVPLGGACSAAQPCANVNTTTCLMASGQTTGT